MATALTTAMNVPSNIGSMNIVFGSVICESRSAKKDNVSMRMNANNVQKLAPLTRKA
jgi:hypothetical protein